MSLIVEPSHGIQKIRTKYEYEENIFAEIGSMYSFPRGEVVRISKEVTHDPEANIKEIVNLLCKNTGFHWTVKPVNSTFLMIEGERSASAEVIERDLMDSAA